MSFILQTVIFLGGAVLLVPLFHRWKLGSVLAYLTVGIIIGPSVLGLVGDVESILHFAELGVVLLLFIIGLELKPSRLWVLRRSVFGLGAAQVLITGFVLSAAAMALGLGLVVALVVGFGLALSSTAFVLQTLAEKGELTSLHGRSAFAVLLFQDLAVIPMLAVLPALSPDSGGAPIDVTVATAKALAALVSIVLVGRYLLRPVFRLVASTANREIFIALTLFIVLGVALLMQSIGLSMALGAFIAGVLLADSEYRHELEANIEPFKGLLLGLFFIAVGMGADLSLIVDSPVTVLLLVAGLVAIKFVVVAVLGRVVGRSTSVSVSMGLSLAQGGEFAFVLFAAAGLSGLLDRDLSALLIVVVTVSLALAPLLFFCDERFIRPRLKPVQEPDYDNIEDAGAEVIIAGFGRFGQIVGRTLLAQKIPFTALDRSQDVVHVVRRFGQKVYFGDVARLDLLRAAGAEHAKLLVVTVSDVETSLRVVEQAKRYFPHLKLYVRARNRQHAYQLLDIGVTLFVRDTILSSLWLTKGVLRALGTERNKAARIVDLFFAHDRRAMFEQHAVYHDESKLIQSAAESARELAELLATDEAYERATQEDDAISEHQDKNG